MSDILINHIGYNNSGVKKFVFQTKSKEVPKQFMVADSDHQIIYKGELKEGGQIDEWHTGKAYEGYFSNIEKTGSYQITIHNDHDQIISTWFKIERDIIQSSCLPLILEGFKSQHPDNKYEEKDTHISFFGNRNDHVDVHGGWYDASGDVSKYLSHLSYANYLNPQQTPLVIWSMLESYEMLQKKSSVSNHFRESLVQEAVIWS